MARRRAEVELGPTTVTAVKEPNPEHWPEELDWGGSPDTPVDQAKATAAATTQQDWPEELDWGKQKPLRQPSFRERLFIKTYEDSHPERAVSYTHLTLPTKA